MNGTRGGTPFAGKRGKLKSARSKIVLTIHRVYTVYFPKKEENLNHPVKNSVSIMLFSQERAKLKISQSRIALTVKRVQSYFA